MADIAVAELHAGGGQWIVAFDCRVRTQPVVVNRRWTSFIVDASLSGRRVARTERRGGCGTSLGPDGCLGCLVQVRPVAGGASHRPGVRAYRRTPFLGAAV